MNKDDNVYLRHILDAIQRIEEYTKGINYNNLLNNNLIQDSVIRELEIIGKQQIKKRYPDTPKRKWQG